MKRATFSGSILCLFLCTLTAQAQYPPRLPVHQPPRLDPELANKKITLHLQNATPDDHIVELARAADLNIIADATEFPATTPATSGERPGSVFSLLSDLMKERNLTHATWNSRTLLLWSKPDMVALAKDISDGHSLKLPAKIPGDQAFGTLLTDYYKREHGWDGQSRDFSLDIKVGDLPPDIRAQVITKTQVMRLSSSPNLAELSHYAAWFADSFWQEARVWVGLDTLSKTPTNMMLVGISSRRWTAVRSLVVDLRVER